MSRTEDQAREKIDESLRLAGWVIQNPMEGGLNAARGIAIRAFPLDRGYGFADYLLYLDGKAVGVLEAKKVGFRLTGGEVQSKKYSRGLPLSLPLYTRPLPFLYQSTGEETRFTNRFDPEPRSRAVFAFHRPETLLEWLEEGMIEPTTRDMVAEASQEYGARGRTFHERMRINMPPLVLEGLWPAQIQAIKNLEQSLREGRPRALIQMATGSGMTFTAISLIYRLIKFSSARRVLFLVDRRNLGDQALKAFQGYVSPYNTLKFTEEYTVQGLSSNALDPAARVCISTVQRMVAMLKGKGLAEEDESKSITYNRSIPIETFDIIVTDECHPSIYKRWGQILRYFDASLIGFTATPDKEAIDFFNQNLVMGEGQEKDLSGGLNVITDIDKL